jgi:hypothetical protein
MNVRLVSLLRKNSDQIKNIFPDDAKKTMEDIKFTLIRNIFKTLLPEIKFTIKLVGQGAFGEVYTDSSQNYVIKLSKLPILGDQSLVYCDYFQREVKHKTDVYRIYDNLKNNNISLSPLLFIDPGIYGEYDLVSELNSKFPIKRCWIIMKRIIMCSSTETKQSSRQMLYDGEITENMTEIIRAVAQIYAIHLVGAQLRIAKDLELVVGCDNGGKQIVSLIDYGQVLPLYEKKHNLFKKTLSKSVMLMKKNIPLDPKKYDIFRVAFLEIAMATNHSLLGKKILRMLKKKKKYKKNNI